MKNNSNMWSGRFDSCENQALMIFNESISFDYILWKEDLKGTLAHVKMLNRCNLITDNELKQIHDAVQELYLEIENQEVQFSIEHEDIHTNIEVLLSSKIGDLSKKIHTGRSRNDQIATDMRLYSSEKISDIISQIKLFCETLINIAYNHTETVMIGYTHLQQAQPISLSHYFLSHVEKFLEDIDRMNDSFKRIKKSPLGASSIAGSSLPIDRYLTSKELGFEDIIHNSLNAISNRDFIIEIIGNLSILSLHLSTLCEDVVIFSSTEFGFFEIHDSFATGSSLMPNKKNPDVPELIRGKVASVIGNFSTICLLMKNLTSGYNKDMQEDKKSLFSSVQTIQNCLNILIPFFNTLSFDVQKMKNAVKNSYCLSTDILDYLVTKGVYFRDAHNIVGKIVKFCIAQKKYFHDLSLSDFQNFSNKFCEDIFNIIDINKCLYSHQSEGSPNPNLVKNMIKIFSNKLYDK